MVLQVQSPVTHVLQFTYHAIFTAKHLLRVWQPLSQLLWNRSSQPQLCTHYFGACYARSCRSCNDQLYQSSAAQWLWLRSQKLSMKRRGVQKLSSVWALHRESYALSSVCFWIISFWNRRFQVKELKNRKLPGFAQDSFAQNSCSKFWSDSMACHRMNLARKCQRSQSTRGWLEDILCFLSLLRALLFISFSSCTFGLALRLRTLQRTVFKLLRMTGRTRTDWQVLALEKFIVAFW